MTSSVRLGMLGLLVLGACARVGVSPPGPAPSVGACRVPQLDGISWREVDGADGVTYRIPTGFVERTASQETSREFRSDQGLSGRVIIGYSPSTEHYMTLRRAPSPPMHEMSECVTPVGGRDVLFQAWRTDGGIFRNGRRYPLYEVIAWIPVTPTRTLYVTGGGSTPEFQEVLLAIARSVEIDPS